MSKQILALIGSPRARSTSGELARYVAEGLEARGWESHTLRLGTTLRKPDAWEDLECRFAAADTVLLSCPLYVDSLPGDTTEALERLAGIPRRERPGRLAALVQCGFIGAENNDPAVDICRLFAREAGLSWAGGLAIGGGGGIDAKPIAELGAQFAHVRQALDLTIEALDAGQEIPAEALALTRRPMCPSWAYAVFANLGMLHGAWKKGNLLRIHARPYR